MHGVPWKEAVQESFSEERDHIAAHCYQQRAVGEHHGTSSSSSDCYSISGDSPQSSMFTLEGVVFNIEIVKLTLCALINDYKISDKISLKKKKGTWKIQSIVRFKMKMMISISYKCFHNDLMTVLMIGLSVTSCEKV